MKKEREEVEKEISDIVAPVVEEMNLELVDVEYMQDGGYWYVRIYIDSIESEKGVDLDDCTTVSRACEEKIDALIEEKFFLEVSSPGLERPLKKEKDFVRFIGERVSVKLKHKLNETKNVEGILEKFENDIVYIECSGEIVEIPFKEIKKANLVFEFEDID